MKKHELKALRKLAEEIEKSLAKPLKVCNKSCDQCLFTKNKIVSDERKTELLNICVRDDTHFICHKGSAVGENIVCNGFYRNRSTTYLELLKATGRIEFVEPSKLPVELKKDEQEQNEKKLQTPKRGKRLR
jgi:hypothetical protein